MGEEREAERIRQISYFAAQCGITGEKKSPEETEAALKENLSSEESPTCG